MVEWTTCLNFFLNKKVQILQIKNFPGHARWPLTTRNRTKDTLISAFHATVRCSANWAMVSHGTGWGTVENYITYTTLHKGCRASYSRLSVLAMHGHSQLLTQWLSDSHNSFDQVESFCYSCGRSWCTSKYSGTGPLTPKQPEWPGRSGIRVRRAFCGSWRCFQATAPEPLIRAPRKSLQVTQRQTQLGKEVEGSQLEPWLLSAWLTRLATLLPRRRVAKLGCLSSLVT